MAAVTKVAQGTRSAGVVISSADIEDVARAVNQTIDEVTANNVTGDGTITKVVKVTQAQYDAIVTKSATTLYVIEG